MQMGPTILRRLQSKAPAPTCEQAKTLGPVEPVAELAVELARGFAFGSLAVAKTLDPAFDFGPSMRSARQMADEHLQMSQLLLDQFVDGQSLLAASVLQRCVQGFTLHSAIGIHLFPSDGQWISCVVL